MITVGIYIQDSVTLDYNRVDLFDDEKISVTSSIQNINDISKTYTDFSQTFTVPASKQNNKIFKHWYDNSNDAPFSTLIKADTYIEIDTIPFRKGKIQLESANVVDGQAQDYSITFIGILGNLKDTFAGKYLKDLTLDTTYDFEYTADLVKNKVTTQTTSPAYPDIKFPLISSARNWVYGGSGLDDINDTNTPIRYNELFPALRLRAVLNMIETQFGINFDGTATEPSNFLNNDARFTNAYLYLKNADEFEAINEEVLILFDTVGALTYSPSPPVAGVINLFQVPPILNNKILTSNFNNVDINYYRYVRLYMTFNVANVPITVRLYTNNGLDSTVNIITSTSEQNVMNYFKVAYQSFNEQIYFTISSSSNLTFTTRVLLVSRYNYEVPNPDVLYFINQNITKATNQTLTASTLIPIKSYMPEIKIEDFFSGLLKMFNLTCYSTDGINYTVEQLESYYGAGIDTDITKYVLQDKKALNRVKTYKRINFEYEKSESFVNVAFNSNAGIEYGSLYYVNNPITEGEEYSVKLPFEDLNFSNLKDKLQVGYCLKTDYQKYIPKPVILYDYNPSALTTLTGTTFYISTATSGTGSNTTVTAYKAFGQETLISGETYGLNFNQQQSTLTNEIVNNSLYQNYYEQYFANIYNLKARLIKVSAILPTSILTTLKLNDNIIIRDAKYLINSYTTDLTTGLVQFELLTDQRE
jgi:hypothetical protein